MRWRRDMRRERFVTRVSVNRARGWPTDVPMEVLVMGAGEEPAKPESPVAMGSGSKRAAGKEAPPAKPVGGAKHRDEELEEIDL